MPSLVGAGLVVVGFAVLAHYIGLVRWTNEVVRHARDSMAVLGDRELDDRAKERALREKSVRLFALLGLLVLGSAVAVLVPLGVIWLLDRLGVMPLDRVLAVLVQWQFLLAATVVGTAVFLLLRARGRWRERTEGFGARYALGDRLLHRVAFATAPAYVTLSHLEDRLYARRLEGISSDRPVFVTSLPRAGTTALLNVLAGAGEFASHTYEDMPFVLCPLAWQGFSRRFSRQQGEQERLHGDGLMISQKSPEALEELIWRLFWPDHYRRDRITPWEECRDPEFVRFFASHMRKIVAARTTGGATPRRYMSKNNANIARLGALTGMLPDARVIVPFREPVQHAASLHLQHVRFLDMHRTDPFSRRYMAGIGHHDFGANLLPIDFDGWLAGDRRADAVGLAFWLEYWVAAFRHILGRVGDRVRLLSYADLTERPAEELARLAAYLDVADPPTLTGQAPTLHPPRTHEVDMDVLPPGLLDEARALHDALRSRAAPA